MVFLPENVISLECIYNFDSSPLLTQSTSGVVNMETAVTECDTEVCLYHKLPLTPGSIVLGRVHHETSNIFDSFYSN